MEKKKPETPKRGITEPPTSTVIKGPRLGFIEDLETNLTILKNKLKTADLETAEFTVGKYTQTRVVVVSIKSIADEKITAKVIERIKSINIDGVADSYYIAQFLQDEKIKLFNQVGSDEKPDIITAKLLEGRVAVFVDGSPIVLTVPYVLLEDIQNSDDYYQNAMAVSLKRVIRIVGGIITILAPALYIALQLYHYNIVPVNMLIIITNSVKASPFSPLLEMLFVLVLFEILYEATLNMPKHLSGALGIIGALVLGDTAVKAGLISSPAVLVAAMSGITMYIIPDLAPQISLLKFFFAIVGGVLGLYGIVIVGVLLVIYLAGIDSYGAPYLAPFAPYIKSDTKDAVFKSGIRQMQQRPKSIPNNNSTRVRLEEVGKKEEVH